MANHIGETWEIRTTEKNGGLYRGVVAMLDGNNGRVTLQKVVSLSTDQLIPGQQHFFSREIQEIKVIAEAPKKMPQLMQKNSTPPHLKRIQDLEISNLLLSRQVERHSSGDEAPSTGKRKEPMLKCNTSFPPLHNEETGEESDKGIGSPGGSTGPWIQSYTFIDQLNEEFATAVEYMMSFKIIGLAMSGVDIGRQGKLSLIQMSTSDQIVIFDMQELGTAGLSQGLAQIMEHPGIQKVIHDCRCVSDILHNQYQVKLVNVFDTQVAGAMVFRMSDKTFPRYVQALNSAVRQYLETEDDRLWFKIRPQVEGDKSIWLERPISPVLLDFAARQVRYLRQLRRSLMEMMLQDFTEGVNIYLSVNRDAPEDEVPNNPHELATLPAKFRIICGNMSPRNFQSDNRYHRDYHRFDENGFLENATKVPDPSIVYSHAGISHASAESRGLKFIPPATRRSLNRNTSSITSPTSANTAPSRLEPFQVEPHAQDMLNVEDSQSLEEAEEKLRQKADALSPKSSKEESNSLIDEMKHYPLVLRPGGTESQVRCDTKTVTQNSQSHGPMVQRSSDTFDVIPANSVSSGLQSRGPVLGLSPQRPYEDNSTDSDTSIRSHASSSSHSKSPSEQVWLNMGIGRGKAPRGLMAVRSPPEGTHKWVPSCQSDRVATQFEDIFVAQQSAFPSPPKQVSDSRISGVGRGALLNKYGRQLSHQ